MKKPFFAIIFCLFGCGTSLFGLADDKPAKDLSRQWMTVETKPGNRVDLVRYTVRQLGFGQAATWGQIIGAASERGLRLCPESAGIPLRLAYGDQPDGEMLYIAMDPIAESYKAPSIYTIVSSGGRNALGVFAVSEKHAFPPDTIFVFMNRRQGPAVH
jgi:hypothetical protein